MKNDVSGKSAVNNAAVVKNQTPSRVPNISKE